MGISRDPSEKPTASPEQIQRGVSLGMFPIAVHCEDDDDESNVVSFVSFVRSTPRIREAVQLENGALCKIHNIVWKAHAEPDGLVSMMPNVFAVKVDNLERE